MAGSQNDESGETPELDPSRAHGGEDGDDNDEEQGPAYSPDDVLNQLESRPVASRGYAEAILTESLRAQKQVVQALVARQGSAPQEDSLTKQDTLLGHWLRSCYLQGSALPALSRGTLSALAFNVAKAGVLQPFILEVFNDGRINPGLPTAPDVVCDSLSELLRVAGAAIVCYQHYLSEPTRPDSVPSDDSALLLSSIVIKSMKNKEMCAAADAQLKELMRAEEDTVAPVSMKDCPAYAAFGCAQIAWLMHLIRAELSGYCADVHFLMGDKEKHKDNTVARMQDNLFLLKSVPSNLTGYLRYCRNCLEFQQYKAAHIFSSKALMISDHLHDDLYKSHLLLVQATAIALGAQSETISLQEIVNLEAGSVTARAAVSEWLPEAYSRLAARSLEPEATIIAEHVIKHYQDAVEDGVPALKALYSIPPPSTLPPGALTEAPDDEGIPEGEEGEDAGAISESPPAAAVSQGAKKGGNGPGKSSARAKGAKK